MSLPEAVTIVEVGPRDGLQNEAAIVPAATKVAFIERLAATGLRVVEATSFVSPRWVPQLADADEVLASLRRRPGVRYPVLVPNDKGLDRALAAEVDEIAVFASASEGFSDANLGRSVAASLEMFAPVVTRATAAGLGVRGYVSCVAACPFDGPTSHDDVRRVTLALLELGCTEISLGDTIGVAHPDQIAGLVTALATDVDLDRLAIHAHDTYGRGLANTLAALEAGVAIADTSAGGLGGCPYAPGATGNLATEHLLDALADAGVHTGIDRDALAATSAWMADQLASPIA